MSGRRFSDGPKSLEELILKSMENGSLYFTIRNKRIFDLWPRVVEEAAENTEPYRFEAGVLYARVKASVYLDRYHYKLKEWVERYAIELGGPVVETIRLRLVAAPGQAKKTDQK
ncbi:MAG: DUF721 domain-containing protein [Deltaproteobacteria bacterium]|nr:DUF721 domain-containing protein [Deltaproteobacteria bacterium]